MTNHHETYRPHVARRVGLASIAVAAALTFAGCGGAEDPAAVDDGAGQGSPAIDSPEPAGAPADGEGSTSEDDSGGFNLSLLLGGQTMSFSTGNCVVIGDDLTVQVLNDSGGEVMVTDSGTNDSIAITMDDGSSWTSEGTPDDGVAYSSIATAGVLSGRGDLINVDTGAVEAVSVNGVCPAP